METSFVPGSRTTVLVCLDAQAEWLRDLNDKLFVARRDSRRRQPTC